jgi:hypothetical protein
MVTTLKSLITGLQENTSFAAAPKRLRLFRHIPATRIICYLGSLRMLVDLTFGKLGEQLVGLLFLGKRLFQ